MSKPEITYPTRARILDVTGETMVVGPHAIGIATPPVSLPHIGKEGLAAKDSDGDVVIILDDGTVLYGYECWWEPVR